MNGDIYLGIIILLLFTVILSGCALLYFLLRNTRLGGTSVSNSDITNQMILFQSMRETVEQQKELARQLNFSIDKKVQDVREVMSSVANIGERIKGAEAELETLISDSKEELQSLHRRLGYIKDQTGLSEPDETEAISEPSAQDTKEETPVDIPIPSVIDAQGNELPYDGTDQLPPLNAIATNFKEKHDFVDSWAGVDFGINELAEEALPEVPEEPEDPEASRDAFRTLLNLNTEQANGDFIERSMATLEQNSDATPAQRRIYEFSDAGMRVPEIARELGLGKGEVKLVLSMRKKQA
jgi:hypothetical protein